MLLHDRLSRIRAILTRNPRCPVSQIQRELGVSRSTVRRDLMKLEAGGDVLRVHGGALNPGMVRGEPTYDRRSGEAVDAKLRIAHAAAEMVGDGQSVFIDAGTTCFEAGRLLLLRENVRIFTNSLRLLQQAGRGAAEVVSIGGTVRRPTDALTGALSLEWMKRLRFDVALIGASAVNIDEGVSTTELSEAAVKQQAMARARRAVVLADSSKLAASAAILFGTWRSVDAWITEKTPGRAAMRRLRKSGVTVICPTRPLR